MQEDIGARSVAFSDEDIALWLRKELNVAGIRCLEIFGSSGCGHVWCKLLY
jgi:hypothetical protein